jgi:hypothetical protein
VDTVFTAGSDWAVRAFYDFWMALPFVREGMMAAGAYAMNEAGRARFGRFPDVIADDGFCRLQFAPEERVEVTDAVSRVVAPGRFSDLVKIRSRSRLGVYQLQTRFPELYAAERRKQAVRPYPRLRPEAAGPVPRGHSVHLRNCDIAPKGRTAKAAHRRICVGARQLLAPLTTEVYVAPRSERTG